MVRMVLHHDRICILIKYVDRADIFLPIQDIFKFGTPKMNLGMLLYELCILYIVWIMQRDASKDKEKNVSDPAPPSWGWCLWGPIVLLLLSSPRRMEQPPSISSGVGNYQYIQKSFTQPLGRSSTEVQLPRNHTKPPNVCHEWPGCWDWTTGRVTCPIIIHKYK